jgi:hypothetical protein
MRFWQRGKGQAKSRTNLLAVGGGGAKAGKRRIKLYAGTEQQYVSLEG